MAFIEITITPPPDGETELDPVPVLGMTSELREHLQAQGFDPPRFNCMKWPTGASRHASCMVLMHADAFESLVATDLDGDIRTPVVLTMGDLVFEDMYLLEPRPVLVSEASGVLYAVELVDRRYMWNRQPTEHAGFNITTDDKAVLYDATTNSGEPYTVEESLQIIIDEIDPDETDLIEIATGGDYTDLLADVDIVRDFYTQGMPVGQVLDRLAANAGLIVIALREFDEGTKYRIERIDEGAAKAAAILDTHSDDLIAGGLFSSTGDFPDVSGFTGAGAKAFGVIGDLNNRVPNAIQVLFPISTVGGGAIGVNVKTETESGWNTDRFHVRSTPSGRPAGIGTGGEPDISITKQLYSVNWAFADPDNGGVFNNPPAYTVNMSTMADRVAQKYYQRYNSGAGKMTMRGLLDIESYSGASTIEWSLFYTGKSIVPITRIEGDWDDPIFGWNHDNSPLMPRDIMTTGIARAFPRGDGGLMINVPAYPTEFDAVIVDDPSAPIVVNVNRRWRYNIAEIVWEWNSSSSVVEFDLKTDGITGEATVPVEFLTLGEFEAKDADCPAADTGQSAVSSSGSLVRRFLPVGTPVRCRLVPTENESGISRIIITGILGATAVCGYCDDPAE
jgi:hypothetical protein